MNRDPWVRPLLFYLERLRNPKVPNSFTRDPHPSRSTKSTLKPTHKATWAQGKLRFLASVEQNVMKTSTTDRLLQALSSWECLGFVSKSEWLRALRGVGYPWKDGSVFQWIVRVWRVPFHAPGQRSDCYVRGEAWGWACFMADHRGDFLCPSLSCKCFLQQSQLSEGL